jgi:hypothetical protein
MCTKVEARSCTDGGIPLPAQVWDTNHAQRSITDMVLDMTYNLMDVELHHEFSIFFYRQMRAIQLRCG